MTGENRRINVADELQAAARMLAAALRNAEASDFDTAANRLYFAALHAVRAVCLSEGLEPKSHRGLKSLLAQHFVLTGRLADWTVTVLSQLETDRDLADYVVPFAMPEARYRDREQQARRLLDELEAFLRAAGWS